MDQMNAFTDPIVTESPIPLEVLYNSEIEKIRVLEYEKQAAPCPIKFDI